MLIVLCGLPGSGKTTLSKKLAELYEASIYHYDEMPRSLKRQGGGRARNQMHYDMRSDLLQDIDVVIDDLNLRRDDRINLLLKIRDIICDKILVVCETPLDVCITRNRSRERTLPDDIIKFANKQFQIPALDEGWDFIIYYEGE